jgi:hypothetical protein
LVSQSFDFGLLWPGAALMTGTLVGMPIARASLAPRSVSSPREKSLWSILCKPMRTRTVRVATIGFLSLTALATWQLHNDAHAAYAKRLCDNIQAGSFNAEELEYAALVVDRTRRRVPRDTELKIGFAGTQILRARHKILLSRIDAASRLEDVLAETDLPEIRREFWNLYLRSDSEATAALPIPPQAMEHLTIAADQSRAAMQLEPLNDAAITQLVLLDFLDPDLDSTRWRLQRLIDLRPRSHRVMRRVAELPSLQADQVISSDTKALAVAAQFETKVDDPDLALLQRAIPALHVSLTWPPDHALGSVNWGDVLIRTQVSLGNNRKAAQLASRIARPDKPGPWLLLSRMLIAKGDRSGARMAAQSALQLAPDDHAVRKLLDSLRESESAGQSSGSLQ